MKVIVEKWEEDMGFADLNKEIKNWYFLGGKILMAFR